MPYPFTTEPLPSTYVNTMLLKGGKNRIINGNFEINQRGYTSGTNLASGAYGFDRWKSGFTNTALTFTDGVQATTVTISSSGVLQQIVERENVPADTYTLSWTGTATGRVYNSGATPPAYAASPITVSLNGLADVVVEFTASGGTRTLGLVQLERGAVPSPFEYRHRGEELALCQRYYEKSYALATVPGTATDVGLEINSMTSDAIGQVWYPVTFKVTKRANPTMTMWTNAGGANQWIADRPGVGTAFSVVASFTSEGKTVIYAGIAGWPAWTASRLYGHWVASAEL